MEPVYKPLETQLQLSYTYDQLSSAQYLFDKYECKIAQEDYSDLIQQKILVNLWYLEALKKELTDRQLTFL